MPRHTLHLYQKPAVGSSIIRRYTAYNYRHKIAAVGGFDTASCDLLISRSDAEIWLEQYLGNRVAFFVDNPVEPIWEGLVNRISYQVANVTFTASLDQLYNRTQTRYNLVGTGIANTTAANNTDSQAVYGIKQGTLDGRIRYSSEGADGPNALRDLVLATHAWPRISTAFGSGNAVLLSVEFVGFYHTLEWEVALLGGNTAANADVIVAEKVAACVNGTTFFDSADATLIDANTSFQPARLARNGQTLWQFLQSIQEAGDGASAWVMGIEPTPFGSTTRRFYYRAANTDVEYMVRLTDGMKIRNKYGGVVQPWRVQPDRGIRLSDALIGWNGLGDDPREAYLEVVDYDAESQSVAWQTSDNIELEGAFQLRRYYKTHGTRFGEHPVQAE